MEGVGSNWVSGSGNHFVEFGVVELRKQDAVLGVSGKI